ncbi:hypothetical protein U9M48_006173 [Paspalum notatum var. saurae]|uniref:Uncharacterized protein n=1 Tax=Paspalum notatum var. saurae TaxID=547442 RepID=A0AAQ3PRP6_PASNO
MALLNVPSGKNTDAPAGRVCPRSTAPAGRMRGRDSARPSTSHGTGGRHQLGGGKARGRGSAHFSLGSNILCAEQPWEPKSHASPIVLCALLAHLGC